MKRSSEKTRKRGRSFIKMAESERSILISGMFCCIYASHFCVCFFSLVCSLCYDLLCSCWCYFEFHFMYFVLTFFSVSFFCHFVWDSYRKEQKRSCWIMFAMIVHLQLNKMLTTIKAKFTTHERQNQLSDWLSFGTCHNRNFLCAHFNTNLVLDSFFSFLSLRNVVKWL